MCSLNKFSSVVKIGREILIALFSVCGEDETGLFVPMLTISPLMWSLVSSNVMVEALLKMFVFLKG